mgnify:CR=1 FL=1
MVKYNLDIKKAPFTHTYSIVARDTLTGEMGVGVQSHYFSVGSIVSWGESGVGVVATQSLVNASSSTNRKNCTVHTLSIIVRICFKNIIFKKL